MSSPLVSVIMPTQGLRDSLGEALASVLDQTYPNFEVVVVDDSPTDRPGLVESGRWAQGLRDPRVRVVAWRRCAGCAAAKQAGLAAASGSWVCYLDDDNVMLPERLAASVEVGERSDAAMLLGGLEIEVAGRVRRRQNHVDHFTGDARLLNTVPDTNVLFHRRDVPVEWDADLRTTDDAVFFHRVIAATATGVVPNVTRCLVRYRVHAGDRANSDVVALHRGQRRLLTTALGAYSRSARRLTLRRMLVAREKLRSGRWRRFFRLTTGLWRAGGASETRLIANALLVKFPLTRRWMVR